MCTTKREQAHRRRGLTLFTWWMRWLDAWVLAIKATDFLLVLLDLVLLSIPPFLLPFLGAKSLSLLKEKMKKECDRSTAAQSGHRRRPCVPSELNLGLAGWRGTRVIWNEMVLCERSLNIAHNHTSFQFLWCPPKQMKGRELTIPRRYCVPQATYVTQYSVVNKID